MEKAMIKRRMANVVGSVLLLTMASCSSQSGSNGSTGQVVIEPTMGVLAAAALPGQSATLDILGLQTGIPMTVNPDGTVVATVGNLPVGTRTFRITYRSPSVSQVVTVAEASGTGNIVAGVTTTVTLSTLRTDFDDDSDEASNLDEVKVGSDPVSATSRPTNATTVAAGFGGTCARLFNGTVRCWGGNSSGQLGNGTTTAFSSSPVLVTVDGIPIIATAVSSGISHSCAVLSTGTVQCWGLNSSGQLGDGSLTVPGSKSSSPVLVSGITTATAVAAGGKHSCAVFLNGTVQCWGANSSGQLGNGTITSSLIPVLVTGITTATAVTAGSSHSCARLSDGTVQCWGFNGGGQLGDGGPLVPGAKSLIPVTVSGIGITGVTPATDIEAGSEHTCARLSDGTVRCWGIGSSGQLGNGTTTNSSTPVPVKGENGIGFITTATAVTGGSSHSCARLSTGTVQCWGDNGQGRLGDGTQTPRLIPVTVSGLTTATAVSAGLSHSCAVLSTGRVQCWGFKGGGQLGDGTASLSTIPVVTSGLTTATAVTGGSSHSCARLSDGTVWCWGDNIFGQLGDGSNTDSNSPVPVIGLTTATAVSAGRLHSCARLSDGTVWCWGDNFFGQLGNGFSGVNFGSFIPVQVSGITTATSVSVGENYSCAVFSSGTVQCWGLNSGGQLGDGTQISPRLTPVPVTGIITATAVSATIDVSNNHSCVRLSDGTVRCWGDNFLGQLGNGTITSSLIPVLVTGITTATSVSAGFGYSCARLSSGNVQCWGNNHFGQLGNGTATDVVSLNPVLVSELTTATSVSAGSGHACARLSTGTVQCWGNNISGQLGDGTVTNSPSPILVSGLTTATSVSAGLSHNCAVLLNGTVQCWGGNSNGQLGDGFSPQSLVPSTVLGIP